MIDLSKAIVLIKKYEGLKLTPYKCPAGLPTIGYGSTFYEDSSRVKINDIPITKERAEDLLKSVLNGFYNDVKKLIKTDLNENQWCAVLSFVFNVGVANFSKSTLLKKINANPKDASIKQEFAKWVYSNKIKLNGLVNRRDAEALLYMS